jgi:hypothetical protein
MKQTVLDLNAFFCKPTKKTIRRHKRIIGISPQEKYKNMKKRQDSRAEKKEKLLALHNHNIQEWEEYLQSSSVIDQECKNAEACLQAFGPAPIHPRLISGEVNSKDEEYSLSSQTSSISGNDDSILSDHNVGCKLSP